MCLPKKYLTFDCTHDRMIFAPGKHLFLLDLTKHTIETFLFFLRERNKFSRKRKKKKDLMDNTYFFYLEITSLDFTSEKKKNNLLTSSQKHRRETGNNNLTCEVDWLFFLPRESFFCFMCETEREQIVQGEKLFFYSI